MISIENEEGTLNHAVSTRGYEQSGFGREMRLHSRELSAHTENVWLKP
ncbi:MAG: hypothetical protein QOD06_2516 [Candidatus Binatota bacterium]|jgi:hypothetical protein|nr:hypothetical protein [Candidatus Binatota bacterium]